VVEPSSREQRCMGLNPTCGSSSFSQKEEVSRSQVVLLCCLVLYWIGLVDLYVICVHSSLPLKGRLFSYVDTHRHRLGPNYHQIPVNCEESAGIVLSELHHLSNVGKASSVDDVPVTIKRIIGFDIRGCADTAKDNRRRYSKVVFQTARRISRDTLRTRHIKKRDNNPPTFSKQHYNVEVAENSPPGTTVTTVQASDPDSGTNGHLVYSMEAIGNSNSADYFQLNPITGVMTTIGRYPLYVMVQECVPSYCVCMANLTDYNGKSKPLILRTLCGAGVLHHASRLIHSKDIGTG